MKNRKAYLLEWFGLLGILLIAACVRLYLMPNWLEYDECQHFLIAKSPFFEDFLREFRLRAHPPLTYICMKLFIKMGSHAYLAKMVSLLSGLVAIILSYLVLKKFFNSIWIGQIGALSFSFIPVFIIQSIEVRQYSLCLVFIWISLLIYFQMYEHKFQDISDHFLLAIVFLLAIITEYGAIFHIVSLLIIIGILFFIPQIKQRQWKLLYISLSYILVLCFAFGLFYWQFYGNVPTYTHTYESMYEGSLVDFGNIFRFFVNRFPDQMGGILPNPWGLCLSLLLLLPLTPLFRNNSIKKLTQSLTYYSFLCLSFVFIASLLRFFPFGGYSRHTVVILPGIVLTCFSVIVEITRKWTSGKVSRNFAIILISLIFLPGFVQGLTSSIKERKTYKDLSSMIDSSKYINKPAPIVSNWRGRSLISWWFLPKTPRLIEHRRDGSMLFDYEGIEVVQSESPIDILHTAMSYTRQQGQCWIVLANYSVTSPEFSETYDFLHTQLKNNPDVSLIISKKTEFVRPTIIIKIENKFSSRNIEK